MLVSSTGDSSAQSAAPVAWTAPAPQFSLVYMPGIGMAHLVVLFACKPPLQHLRTLLDQVCVVPAVIVNVHELLKNGGWPGWCISVRGTDMWQAPVHMGMAVTM